MRLYLRQNINKSTSIEVIHPFVGYVLNPESDETFWEWGKPNINALGFESEWPWERLSDSSCVRVAVFGGSVAKSLAHDFHEEMAAAISLRWGGREVVVVPAALGGYKQPQQLMLLVWLLSLGYGFDLVINVDGFNEVALYESENRDFRVNPSFPRGWSLRVSHLADRRIRLLVAEIQELLAWKPRDSWLRRTLLRWGPGAAVERLIRKTRDSRVAALQSRLGLLGAGDSFLECGPVTGIADRHSLYEFLATTWWRSSHQMSRIVAANGGRYCHVLHPNQYLEGTKTLSESERARSYDERHPYCATARRGYPYLQKAGANLERLGVNYYDLTDVFRHTTEEIYIDKCCHVNRRGNQILGRSILEKLEPDLGRD